MWRENAFVTAVCLKRQNLVQLCAVFGANYGFPMAAT
jgi:hypothetical protein